MGSIHEKNRGRKSRDTASLKRQSNEILNPHFFSSFEPAWATDQQVTTILILVTFSPWYSYFFKSPQVSYWCIRPLFSSGQCTYQPCQPEIMITPTRFNALPSWRTIQWTAKWPREEACHPREGIPVMPRTKPEGETQAGNPPMGRGFGRQDYSSLKTAGKGTGITDHSCPPLYTPPPPSHRALGGQQVDPWAREGGKGGGGGITWITAESQLIERPLGQ